MRYKFPGLKRILADGGYRGETVRNTVMRLLQISSHAKKMDCRAHFLLA